MDRLARWQRRFPAAPARAGDASALRVLRHACLAVFLAAPALVACPTLQRSFDGSLNGAALALVQSSFDRDDSWNTADARTRGDASDPGAPLADPIRPVAMAAQMAVRSADVVDLLAVRAAPSGPGIVQADDNDDGRHAHVVMPAVTYRAGGTLFAMLAANTDQARDDAPFRMSPGTPAAQSRPHPAASDAQASEVASEPPAAVIAPPTVLPIDVTPVVVTPESLITSVPPVVPPASGPPVTVVPESGPVSVIPPPVGTVSAPPLAPPPAGGGKPGPGDGIVPGPGPARPLPEPATAWLALLALALSAATLRARRAPRAARAR